MLKEKISVKSLENDQESIEQEESLSDLTERTLSSFKEVCEVEIAENRVALENSANGTERDACLSAEKKIDNAVLKQESAIVVAFKEFVAKKKSSIEKSKNIKKSEEIYKKVGEMISNTSSRKIDKSLKRADVGDLSGLNKAYNKAFKNFPKYVEEYKKLDTESLEKTKVSNIENQMIEAYNRLILHQLKNNNIDAAIELWRDCPKKESSYRTGYYDSNYMIGKIKDKILEGADREFSSDDDQLEMAAFLKKELKNYPDIYLGCIKEDYASYKAIKYKKAGIYDEVMEKILADENLHSAINFIDIGNDLIKIKSQPKLIEVAFKEYLKVNPGMILENISIFADEIDKLSEGERASCLNKIIKNFSDAAKVMNFVNFDEQKVVDDRYYSETESEVRERVKDFLYGNDLANLTNSKYFEKSAEDNKETLEYLKNNNQTTSLNYILLHPEKYPNVDKTEVIESLKKIYSSGDALEDIFLDTSSLNDEQKKEILDKYLSDEDSDVWRLAADLFRRSSYLMTAEWQNFLVEKLIDFSKEHTLWHDDVEFLEGLPKEQAYKILDNVKEVDACVFVNKLREGDINFFNEHQEMFLKKVGDINSLLSYLTEANSEISTDVRDGIIDSVIKSSPVKDILNLRHLFNEDSVVTNKLLEIKHEFVNRVIETGDFSDLKKVLNNADDFFIGPEKSIALTERMIALANKDETWKLINSTYLESFELETDVDIANLFIKFNNPEVIFNVRFSGLPDDIQEKLSELIINRGGPESRLRLLGCIPNMPGSDNNKNEKTDRLITSIISKGDVLTQSKLLFTVPINKLDGVVNNIIESGDSEAVLNLLEASNNGRLDLSQTEKQRLTPIIIDGDVALKTFVLKNNIFDLSLEDKEKIINYLANENASCFLDIIKNDLIFNKFDNSAKERIIDNFLEKNVGLQLLEKYSDNFDHDCGFILTQKQIEKIANNSCDRSHNSVNFLGTICSIYEKMRAQGKEIPQLLNKELYIKLIPLFLNSLHYENINQIRQINEEAFDLELLEFLEDKDDAQLFLHGIRELPNKEVFSDIKEKIISLLKEKEINKEIDTRCLLDFYSVSAANNFLSQEDLAYTETLLAKEENQRERLIDFSKLATSILKNGVSGLENFVDKKIIDKLTEFENKYSVSEKGKTIFALTIAKEYKKAVESNYDSSLSTIVNIVSGRLEEYDRILSKYNPEDIPNGFETSIGIEYEATKIISDRYKEKTKTSYKDDASNISSFAGVGRGSDAEHEFALKPTNNPYLVLLEMKLLQDLDFVDFNFLPEEQGGYQGAGSGMHLTLGGEKGLSADEQVNFLQNTILAADFGGVYSGQEVSKTARGRAMSLRDRNSNSVKVFDNITPSVELRCLSIDKVEQFERAILISHYGAIAIQATEEYVETNGMEYLVTLNKEKFPETCEELFNFLRDKNYLKNNEKEIDIKTQDIIYQWLKLQSDMLVSVSDHNDNFLNNETVGYLDDNGVWVDAQDFTRGRNNEKSFAEVISKEGYTESLGDYFEEKMKIDLSSMFLDMNSDLANKFTRINNLYLKGDKVNILNMLNTTIENGFPVSSDFRSANDSVFDKTGEKRRGRYYLQGSSDKLLVNRAQDLLLSFLSNMEEVLAKKQGVEANEIAA